MLILWEEGALLSGKHLLDPRIYEVAKRTHALSLSVNVWYVSLFFFFTLWGASQVMKEGSVTKMVNLTFWSHYIFKSAIRKGPAWKRVVCLHHKHLLRGLFPTKIFIGLSKSEPYLSEKVPCFQTLTLTGVCKKCGFNEHFSLAGCFWEMPMCKSSRARFVQVKQRWGENHRLCWHFLYQDSMFSLCLHELSLGIQASSQHFRLIRECE